MEVSSSSNIAHGFYNSFESSKKVEDFYDIAEVLYRNRITLISHVEKMCSGDLNSKLTKESALSQYCVLMGDTLSKIKDLCSPENLEKYASLCVPFSNKIDKKNVVSYQKFEKYCKNTLKKILEAAASNIGVSILTHKFQINDLSLKKRCRNIKDYEMRINALFCQHYVLFKLHREKLESWLVGETDSCPLFLSNENPYDVLTKEMGYFPVKYPKAGDVIAYTNDLRKITHFGIFADPLTVHSKIGSMPQIYSHPVKAVRKYYGTSYLIFRKGAETPYSSISDTAHEGERKLIERLDKQYSKDIFVTLQKQLGK